MSSRPEAELAFAESLRSLRASVRMTQAQLADKMAAYGFKWHPATVYKVENGERQIQLAEAVELAHIFDTNVEAMTGPVDKELDNLREKRRRLRESRSYVAKSLAVLRGDAGQLAAMMQSRNEQVEKLSPGEYEGMWRDAHPDTDVEDAITKLIEALQKWTWYEDGSGDAEA